MQIPSSLTSLISSWLPNLWDTETKAKNKPVPDLCGLSLDQVLHIYKDEGFCPARAVNEGPPSPFIRELEQNSFQQKQLTSSIFHYMGSTTGNLNRISARLDKLEPVVLEKVVPICALLLLFSVSANFFLLRKMNGMQAQQTQKSEEDFKILEENLASKFKKDLDDLKANLEKSLNEKIDSLQSTLSGLETSQSTKNEELTTSINTLSDFVEGNRNTINALSNSTEEVRSRINTLLISTDENREKISAQSIRMDGISLQIKGVQNALAKTEDKISSIEGELPKPNSSLETAQAAQLSQHTTEIAELRGTLNELKADLDELTGEIDDLVALCRAIGAVVQNMVAPQQEKDQISSVSPEVTNQQLVGPWLSQLIEKVSKPRSRASSWNGSQRSLNSIGGPRTESPPSQ